MKPLPPDVRSAMRAAAKMPLCSHSRTGERFYIEHSAVCDWLVEQPEIRQLVFNWCKRNSAIQFDLETGGWRGTAWKEDVQHIDAA